MHVKYLMKSPQDYRGNVKLVVGAGAGDVAYSNVSEVDDDMIPLIPSEISLVLQESPGLWLTEREEYQRRLDDKADQIRLSYLYNGRSTIVEEYKQVEEVANRWIAAGKPTDAIPQELTLWAEINNQSVEWALQSVLHAAGLYRGMVLAMRNLRLRGKHDMKILPREQLLPTLETYLEQMEAYRCPVEY